MDLIGESMDLREAMKRAVLEGGAIAMRHYGKAAVELKADDSVVTAADREICALLQERTRAILPEAAYIGEEAVLDDAALRRARESEYVWVVDPIDGTGVFTDGIETFCISLGLMRGGRPYAGAVYFPALKHLYEGCAGQGAWHDGQPAQVIRRMPVPDRAVLYVEWDWHLYYHIAYPGRTRSLGSAAMHYCLVARGAAVGAVGAVHIWDYLGTAAILQEAGGIIKHLDGREVQWREHLAGGHIEPALLAAPPALWDWLAGTVTFLGRGGK